MVEWMKFWPSLRYRIINCLGNYHNEKTLTLVSDRVVACVIESASKKKRYVIHNTCFLGVLLSIVWHFVPFSDKMSIYTLSRFYLTTSFKANNIKGIAFKFSTSTRWWWPNVGLCIVCPIPSISQQSNSLQRLAQNCHAI